MSFSRGGSRSVLGLLLLILYVHPAPAAPASPSPDALIPVVSDLAAGDEVRARADLDKITTPEKKGLSPRFLHRYHVLWTYLHPPASLKGEEIRTVLLKTGNEADLVFWRAYQGPLGRKYREAGLARRLSAMFPASNYFHPRGGTGSRSAQFLWRESLDDLKSGHRRLAIRLWERIVAKHSLAPEAGLALQRLPSGSDIRQTLVSRWKILSGMGQKKTVTKEALAYLTTNPSFPTRDRAILFAASGLLSEGKRAEALRLVEEGKAARGPRLLASLRAMECSSLETSRSRRNCIHAFLSDYPLSLSAREMAISQLRQSIAYGGTDLDPLWASPRPLRSFPEGQESQWLLGLWYFSRGDRDKARAIWESLSETLRQEGDPREMLPRVTYFLGRLDRLDGHQNRSQRLFQQTVDSWPRSVYALWAVLSCGQDCPSFPVHFHHPSPPAAHLTTAHRQRLLHLVQMGLWGAAWTDYIAYRDPLMTKERFLRYGSLNLHLDPVRKLVLMDAILGRSRPAVAVSVTESLSPSVLSGFGDSGVKVPWAISIARQESRFDPTVLSIDGAMGVMQLMPMTALSTLNQANPEELKKVRLNIGDLRNDYLNAWIGGLYLKRLFDHFPKNPERAVASYNAGMHSIVRWSGISGMDWDFFIEGIPYKETRRYAREVLWNHEALKKSARSLSISRE